MSRYDPFPMVYTGLGVRVYTTFPCGDGIDAPKEAASVFTWRGSAPNLWADVEGGAQDPRRFTCHCCALWVWLQLLLQGCGILCTATAAVAMMCNVPDSCHSTAVKFTPMSMQRQRSCWCRAITTSAQQQQQQSQSHTAGLTTRCNAQQQQSQSGAMCLTRYCNRPRCTSAAVPVTLCAML